VARSPRLPNSRTNPEGLSPPRGYTHVIMATGRRTVYVAGQVALDAGGNLVGAGDLAAQAGQVFANLRTALAAAGAGPADVVKLTTFVVGYTPEHRAAIAEARAAFLGDAAPPASTLVGVQSLAAEGFLIEVEAVAVLE
jgi:enamine deaminase RidA (YjgF/YER057c/UK114 family)